MARCDTDSIEQIDCENGLVLRLILNLIPNCNRCIDNKHWKQICRFVILNLEGVPAQKRKEVRTAH